MDRRSFFKKAGAAGAGVAGASTLAAPAIAQESPTLNWRLTSSFPQSLDTIFGAAETMAEHLRVATDGKFNVQVFAGGEIVGGLEAKNAAADGTVEMAHTASYYYWGQNAAYQLGTATPFALNARMQNAWFYQGGGTEMLNEFYHSEGIHALPCGNTGAQMGGWFNKEINAPDDFNGLKMRIGGFAGNILGKLGVAPQQIAGGEIYQALERGTIDATEWVGPYDDQKLGFNQVAQYYYYPGWWEGGAALHTMINLDAWNDLPAHYQGALRDANAYANTVMLASYDIQNPGALRQLVADGTTLRPFSQEVLAACHEATKEVYQEVSAENQTFADILQAQIDYAREAYLWMQLSEYTFDTYMMLQQRSNNIGL